MADNYQRLPGRGMRKDGGVISTHYARSRLWLADDHLLLVDDVYADQSVRRFFLKDIQSITLRRTNRFAITNAVLGVLFVFAALPAAAGDEPAWRIFFAIITGLFLFFLVINLLMGPTSKGYIQTAVHRVEIPSFARLRNARKALARIIPAIRAVQGELDPAALEEDAPPLSQPTRADLNPAPTPGSVAARGKTGKNDGTNKWHRFVFPLLVVEGAFSLFSIISNNIFMVLAGVGLFVAVAFLSTMAVARQDTPLVSDRLRTLTKVTVGYVLLSVVVGWIEYMAMIVADPSLGDEQHRIFFAMADMDPLENLWLLIHLAFFGSASLLLGLTGMLWYRDQPAETTEAEPVAPPALPQKPARTDLPLPSDADNPPPLPADDSTERHA